MSKESKALAKEAWTSQRVLDLILNNALIIIMVITVLENKAQKYVYYN